MCGICGYVRPAGEGSGETLRRMTDTMLPRGPDDSGTWEGEGVGFGHRRLSIIDLSPLGHQPMANEDGTIHTVFNGEIYNFESLRDELAAQGHLFHGGSDTEVITHAYEEWGLDFLDRLRGMFAIALWDAPRRRLLLARDRLGKKPLYWHTHGDLFLFGSTLAPLMAWPGFQREIDRTSLAEYLTYGYVPAPRSIFGLTCKLPAGHLLLLENGREPLVRRWWDPLGIYAEGYHEELDGDEETALGRLQTELEASIRLRLISDVPLGAFLSGGIDSTLIVALMTRLASGPVRTFSIGYWEGDYDEAPFARRIAAHLGTEHTEHYVTPADALEVIPRLPEVYDEPFGDQSAIPTYLVSRLARQSVTVALSGDGGDELFGGYPRYRWFARARGLRHLPVAVRAALAPFVARLPHEKAPKAASWLGFADEEELYRGLVGIWRRGDRERILTYVPGWEENEFSRVWRLTAGRPPFERLMLTDLHTYLPEDILAKVDRASMAHSLEARTPLLDHEFVTLALRTALAFKFRGGHGKHMLRAMLARLVPRALWDRPKMGFGIPVGRWLRADLRELLLDQTAPDRLRREGFFRPGAVGKMVDEHLRGRRDHQYPLWTLLMFQMWLERWGGR